MTTQELLNYYANLLIKQYVSKPKAYASIQTNATQTVMPMTTIEVIAFSAVAASGTFVLSYNGVNSAAINWNDSTSTIQTKLQAVTGLGSVTVTGTIAGQSLTVTFVGVPPVAQLLTVPSNSLADGSSNPISLMVTETDVTLPIVVENAFQVNGPNAAVGVQLDIIGKYVGVSRNGATFTGPITLDDTDFSIFIQFAILTNSAQSDLSSIQNLLQIFFAGQILVFDYKTMRMDYFMSVGSENLAEMVIVQKRLPKPMGVELGAVIYAPVINRFFGFRTYELPGTNNTPFNSYSSYNMNSPWLSYTDALYVG